MKNFIITKYRKAKRYFLNLFYGIRPYNIYSKIVIPAEIIMRDGERAVFYYKRELAHKILEEIDLLKAIEFEQKYDENRDTIITAHIIILR